jgi:hypothetical protein
MPSTNKMRDGDVSQLGAHILLTGMRRADVGAPDAEITPLIHSEGL